MDLKQQQKLHKAATKYVSAAVAAGGLAEDHQSYLVIDVKSPDRIEFQREVRHLRIALIKESKNPNFASRLARQVDAVAVAELHLAWYVGKPQPPVQELEDKVMAKLDARQKLGDLFEMLSSGDAPVKKSKTPRP